MKFTPAGQVTVAVQPLNGGVEFRVSDTGIGMSRDIQSIIFEPFRQGDGSSTRRFGGVGLGLYIVRRLTEILGGTVSVESNVGCGSTFRVWMPPEATQPRTF
jgi:signal transduction histidine kinase